MSKSKLKEFNKIIFKTKKCIMYGIIIFCSMTILYPLFFTVITSLRDKQSYFEDIYALDLARLNLDNYFKMIHDFEIFSKITNSLIVTIGGVILVLLVSIPAAYYLNSVRKWIYVTIVIFLAIFAFIPEQVLVLSQYKLFLELGLINNYLSVILILASKNLPEAIIFISLIFKSIPWQIIDAARLEGCNESTIIRCFIVPLSISGILIISVTVMLNMWNDFLVSLVMLQDENTKTVITVLARLDQRYASNPPFQMAGTVLAMLPPFVIYAVFKNKIIESVYGNSLK